MLPIHLLIPDAALREAVAEQLQLTGFGAPKEGDVPAAPPAEMTAIILDEAALDAKLIKKLAAIRNERVVILLLGALPDVGDENLCTETFAKPVRLGYLIGRLRFYLEIAPKLRSAPVMIGPYRLAVQQRSLICGDDILRLTEKETALLEYLAQSASPVGRDELLANVWGYDARIDTHTLETHIYQLRKKLGGEWIVNESGMYKLAS